MMRTVLSIIALLCLWGYAHAQVNISGSSCVVAGRQTSYTISGNWNAGSTMTWCVSGGTIVNGGGCKSGTPVVQITVQWSTTPGTGSITLSAGGLGSASMNITISPVLSGGGINFPSAIQIGANSIPPVITATGVGGGVCSTVFYQWQSSIDNVTFTDIEGATGLNLTYTTPLPQNTWVRRRARAGDETAYTNTLAIYVTTPLNAGTVIPASQDVFNTETPVTLNPTLPTGGQCTGAYSYQWLSSTNGVDFTTISGATGPSYSPPKLSATTYYRRRVTCVPGSALSNIAVVRVYDYPTAGVLSVANTTISYNTSPGLISATPATGGMCNGAYTYQWQRVTDGSYVNIDTATGETYTPGNLTATTQFRRVMTCGSVTLNTDPLVITVTPQLQGGTLSAAVTEIDKGTSPGAITGTTATGGNGPYVYQWQVSTNGTNWTAVNSATPLSYTPGNLNASVSYRRRVICGPETTYSNFITILVNTGAPGAYNMNYVRTRTFFKPAIVDDAIAGIQINRRDVSQVTDYYDGLGRQIQKVTRQVAGPNEAPLDLVQLTTYDAFGREMDKYMAYAAGSDGYYKPNPLPDQQAFNAAQFPGESSFLSKEIFEASSLNRTVKNLPPGSSWSGSNRGTEIQYMNNTTADGVRIWNAGSYTSSAVYAAAALTKKVMKDDDGKLSVEFRDKFDKVVLRKLQLADNPVDGHAGWICTYYVYDEQQNLTLIIQPRAVEIMAAANNWNLSANPSLIPEFCYEYSYDQRNRQIMKRFPGTKEQFMLYDKYDRLILTQDAEQRKANKWIFTKYDAQDRVVMTGLLTDATHIGLQSMKSYVEGLTGVGRYEVRDNTLPEGYTTHLSFPVITGGVADWLTVKYYDDYTWCSSQGVNSIRSRGMDGFFASQSNSTFPYARAVANVTQTRGLETGSKVRVLDDTRAANITTLFYDKEDRVMQMQLKHHGGAIDYVVTQYDFGGRVIAQRQRHGKGGANAGNHDVVTRNTYDHAGRLTQVQKGVIGVVNKALQVVVTQTYNNLGELSQKQFGQAATPVETLDYTYHVRGWLQGVNIPYLQGNTTRYFGMELGYDKTTAAVSGAAYSGNRYNGNLSGTIWKSRGDGIERKYDFQYDNVHRLTRADFLEKTNGSWNNAVTDFTVYGAPEHGNKIGYDVNGNILSLFQNGLKLTNSIAVDKMRYTYMNGQASNRLQAVTEDGSIGAANQQLGDFTDYNTTATDYSYDDNGNQLTDQNKRSTVAYNILNLPLLVTVLNADGTQKGIVRFTYDANGNKLKKVIEETGKPAKTVLYINGAIYENDTLQSITYDEGRIRFVPAVGDLPANYHFDYFIKDHLLNTRAVITEEVAADAYPLLSFEGAAGTPDVNNQDVFYENKNGTTINITGVRTTYPVSFAAANPPPAGTVNTYAIAVNKAGGAIGAAKLLKVMSGDRIHAKIKYWYAVANANNDGANGGQSIVSSLLSALTQSVQPSGLIKGNVAAVTSALGADPNLGALLNTAPAKSGSNSAPKAYLNVIFFDEQFRYDKDNSRVFPVEYISDNLQRTIDKTMSDAVAVAKNGYAYVYFSNEAADVVYFDDFQLTHERGQLLEETHYYPFGLTMKGISSRAMGRLENRRGFNGNELQRGEFSDGSGLELYDFNARTHDPQTGRFLQVDPLTEEWQEHMTPYQFGGNNPVRYNDPDGKVLPLLAVIAIRFAVGAAVEYGSQVITNYASGKTGWDAWKTDWRGIAKIGLNGLTSTIDPSGGVWRKLLISQGSNLFESVAGQMLDADPEQGSILDQLSVQKTVTDMLLMNVASKMEIGPSHVEKLMERQLDRAQRMAGEFARASRKYDEQMKRWTLQVEQATRLAKSTFAEETAESADINLHDGYIAPWENKMLDALKRSFDSPVWNNFQNEANKMNTTLPGYWKR